MLIGIDGNEANVERRVGVHQYAFEILWGIYKLSGDWKDKHKVIVYLKNPPWGDLPKENSIWRYKVIPGSGFWIIKNLMPTLFKNIEKPNVFFSPSHYLPPLTSMPKVCTIHDLGYLEFSGQFKKYDFWQLKYWTAISIYISKYIIAVSNATKEDIVRHYSFASKKIIVTHHGYDKLRYNDKISDKDVRRVKKKYSLANDYVLFLSTLKPSKNIEGLVDAFSILRKDKGIGKSLKLVISGKKGWLYRSIFEKVKEKKLDEDVVFTNFICEKDKPALLSGARVFVAPSFWEGFGIHVLEAMACGTPVVVSNIASLPEVASKAGVYVDPYNPEDIAKGIKKVLTMPETEYTKLVENSLEQASKFSWENTARKTLKILEKAGT